MTQSIENVLAANPHIFNHNLETVRRLTPSVRHRATYDRSLAVLKKVKEKRGGHDLHEVRHDARSRRTRRGSFDGDGRICARAGCDILTLGQYLQPSLKHLPVIEFVSPEQFAEYKPRGAKKWVSSTLPAGRWCAVRITRMNFLRRWQSEALTQLTARQHRPTLKTDCGGRTGRLPRGCRGCRWQSRATVMTIRRLRAFSASRSVSFFRRP